MTNETGATGTQAEPETQPPAGTSATQADAGSGEQTQPETFSLEEAKKLRSENSSLRNRLKAFEERERADAESKLSEQEKSAKRIADLEKSIGERDRTLQERGIRWATVAAAARANFTDPEDAYRHLDPAAVEFAEDGTPSNVEALVTGIAKAKPYLLSTRTAGSFDTGTGSGRQAGARSYTREQLRDPKFFAEHRDDILKAQNEGRITA